MKKLLLFALVLTLYVPGSVAQGWVFPLPTHTTDSITIREYFLSAPQTDGKLPLLGQSSNYKFPLSLLDTSKHLELQLTLPGFFQELMHFSQDEDQRYITVYENLPFWTFSDTVKHYIFRHQPDGMPIDTFFTLNAPKDSLSKNLINSRPFYFPDGTFLQFQHFGRTSPKGERKADIRSMKGDSLLYDETFGDSTFSCWINSAFWLTEDTLLIYGADVMHDSVPPGSAIPSFLRGYIAGYQPDGSLLWKKYLDSTFQLVQTQAYSNTHYFIEPGPGKDFYLVTLAGSIMGDDIPAVNYCVIKFSGNGEYLWHAPVYSQTVNEVIKIEEDPAGQVWVVGRDGNRYFFSLLDSLSGLKWEKEIDLDRFASVRGRQVYPSNNQAEEGRWFFSWIKVMENVVGQPFGFPNQSFVSCIDTSGVVEHSMIEGNVFLDVNASCTRDSLEVGVPSWWVGLIGPDYVLAERTDEEGRYRFPAFTPGAYQLLVVPDGPVPDSIWTACQDTLSLQVDSFFQTFEVEHPFQPSVLCPFLTVDIGASRFRRCFDNTIQVHYANEGTLAADSAYIEVQLDPWLDYVSSSIPPAAVDTSLNLYTFDIGFVDVFESSSFTITAYVSCDTSIIGLEHCVEAHIYPDGFCSPPPMWSGADIRATGECLPGDSILLKLENAGDAPMDDLLPFIVIEDELIMRQGFFDLGVLEDTLILLAKSHAFYRLEADQEPGHPLGPKVSVNVDGCGIPSSGLGQGLQFPVWGDSHFRDIFCLPNIGSWDPNEKLAFPQGYGPEHYIEENWKLNYQINFQNTGTDTAFTVVIVDTLSGNLEWDSLDIGIGSHDFVASVDSNVLTFTFNNILLPDSNVNEPASHGFVTFSLYPKLGLAPGTLIENRAGIYFDFNPPIITNTVWHTIEEDFIPFEVLNTDLPPIDGRQWEIMAYPNPAVEAATIELIGQMDVSRDWRIEVYDNQGRLLRSLPNSGARFHLRRVDLPAGLYNFRIFRDNIPVGAGKLIFDIGH